MERPDLFKNSYSFIKSMEALIGRYQEAKKLGISKDSYEMKNKMKCLLCNPIGIKNNHRYYNSIHNDHEISCEKLGCPWMVITGMTCDQFASKRGDQRSIYCSTDKRIMNNRIKQLRRWIEIYKTAISNKVIDK